MLTLPEFIESIGDPAAAKLFEVKLRTVESWRRRERYPRPAQAQMIVDKCAGKVDYAGIFAPDVEPQKAVA